MSESSKPKDVIPFFSSYDFFAYLIPGALLVFSMVLVEQFLITRYDEALEGIRPHSSYPIEKVCAEDMLLPRPVVSGVFLLVPFADETRNWIASLPVLLGIFVLLYVTGHVVSSFSSFVLDRIWVSRAVGYPYVHLVLSREDSEFHCRPMAQRFYRGAFFWVNWLLISVYLNVVTDLPEWRWISGLTALILFGTIVLRAIGKSIKWAAIHGSEALDRAGVNLVMRAVGRYTVGTRSFSFLRDNWKKWSLVYLTVFAIPYDLTTGFLVKYVKSKSTPRHFSEQFKALYREKFKAAFQGLDPAKEGSNNYWLTCAYVAQNAPSIYSDLRNWHVIYSFARNLSTSFFLLFCYFVFYIWKYNLGDLLQYSNVRIALPLLVLMMSWLMFGRYMYIYFSYYSKSLYRSFVFCGGSALSPAPTPNTLP